MPGAVTSDLYVDKDNPSSTLVAPVPPTPPSPAPTPVVAAQPVTTKPRMADELPDGSIRDTSTEAMRPGNDLQFRTFDEDKAPSPETLQEEKAVQSEAAPPVPPEPQKLYAGKFKTPEELEKSYKEAEAALTRKSQEAAELAKKLEQPPAPAKEPTPEEIVAKARANEEFLARFVADPQKVIQEFQDNAARQTQTALQSQKILEDWRKSNPDIAQHEFYVAAETYRLSASDPELAKDPAALLSKATENFRQVYGAIRTEGAREALTTETRVTPLLSSTAPATASEQPAKAPLTFDDAFTAHISMLKAEERRTKSGLRR